MALGLWPDTLAVDAQPQNDIGPPWAFVEVLFGDARYKADNGGTCNEFPLEGGLTVTLRNEDGQDLASAEIEPQDEVDYPEQLTPANAPSMSELACASAVLFRDVPKSGGYRFEFSQFAIEPDNAEEASAWIWINFYSRNDDYRTWYDDEGGEHCEILADNPIKTGAIGEIWPLSVRYETLSGKVGEVGLESVDTGSQCMFEARFVVLHAEWQWGATNANAPVFQQVMFGGRRFG